MYLFYFMFLHMLSFKVSFEKFVCSVMIPVDC